MMEYPDHDVREEVGGGHKIQTGKPPHGLVTRRLNEGFSGAGFNRAKMIIYQIICALLNPAPLLQTNIGDVN